MTNELYNLNIERAVLSAIIFDPEIFESTALKAEYFYLPFHQYVFTAMKKLHSIGKPIDDEFIGNELRRSNQFDETKMIELLSANPITNVEGYKKTLIELSQNRNILRVTGDIRENIANLSFGEIEAKLEQLFKDNSHSEDIFAISNTKDIEGKPPSFYLKDFLPIQEEEINLVSGSGGSGKSYGTLMIATKLKQKHNLNVFAFFSEDNIQNTKHRLNKLRGLHKDIKDIEIDIVGKEARGEPFIKQDRQGNSIPTDYWFKFKKKLSQYDIIIIDPLIAFIGQDENSNTQARYLFNLLNEWCVKENKTIIIIHHHNKDDKSRGASAFVDATRMHYTISKKENNDEDRFFKLEKTNHFKSGSEYGIKLFSGEYGAKKDDKKSTIMKKNQKEIHIEDEGFVDAPPEEWKSGIDSFMEDA